MIAKLIVSGDNREHCLERSERALEHFDVEGVHTTIPFHRLMLDDDDFVAGEHTTKYLDQELDDDTLEAAVDRWEPAEATGGDSTQSATTEITVEVDGRRFDVVIEDGLPQATAESAAAGADSSGGATRESDTDLATAGAVTAEMQGTILSIAVEEGDEVAAGDVLCVLEAMKMENDVVASTSGTVESVPIEEGDSVDMGDTLIILE